MLAVVCAASTTALGENGAGAKPRASDVLRKMTETLQAAKAFSFHAEINFDDVLPSGFKIQYAGAADVLMSKPRGLHVDYRDDVSAKQLWYDGKPGPRGRRAAVPGRHGIAPPALARAGRPRPTPARRLNRAVRSRAVYASTLVCVIFYRVRLLYKVNMSIV